MTRYSDKLTLGFSCIAHSYSHFFILLYATVVLVLEREWGLSYADLQWLAWPGFVMFGVAALPAGWLGDRWSAPGMMGVMFIGLGAAALFTGLSTGTTSLMIGLTGMGVFAAIYHPVGIPWLIKNAVDPSRALGLNGVFGSLGTAFAAIVAGGLADLWSWRAAFLVPGVFSLATGTLFIIAMRRGLIVEAETDRRPQPASSAGDIRRSFMVLALTVISTGMVYQATSVGLPKIFDERLGARFSEGDVSALVAGGFVTIAYICAAVAQVIGGELAERFRLKSVYVFSLLIQVPVMLIAWSLNNPLLIAAAALMVSLSVLGQPAENTLLARYTPLAWRARVFGAKFVLTLGVSSIGVALVPLLHGMTGSLDVLFFVMMGFAGVAGMTATLLPSERQAVPVPAE